MRPQRIEQKPMWDRQLIDRLFVRMQLIYGHRWSSRFDDGANGQRALEAAKVEWAVSLSGVHVDQVAKAIEEMKRSYIEWPPTLPEFMRLVKPEPTPAAHRPYLPALPKPRDPEIARNALAEMRAMLGGVPKAQGVRA